MSRTVTVMIENEALVATLDEEEWTEYSRQLTLDVLRLEEWRRAMAALNAAPPPPDKDRSFVLVGYGCAGLLLGIGVAFGFVLAVLVRH